MNKRMMLGIALIVILGFSLSGCMVVFGEPQLFIRLNVDIDQELQLEYGQKQEFILTATDQNSNKWSGDEVAEWAVSAEQGSAAIGTLDEATGDKVVLTAGNEDAEGNVTVVMGEKSLSVKVKVVEKITE